MNHTVKRVFSVLVSLFILLISITPALALPAPTEDFYVADYAEVIDDATENMIINQNDLLYEQTGAQIVVVTVRYLEDGYYADEYAVKLFNDWGVGDSEKNNGILLLLVTEEGKGWLTQGSGIEAYLTNDEVDVMLEKYFWKKFDNGDYDGAVEALFTQLIGWYEDTYAFTLGDGNYVDTSVNNSSNSAGIFRFMFKLIVLVIILAVISTIANKGRTGRRRTTNYNFWVPPPRVWHHSPTHRPHNYRSSNFRTGSGFSSNSGSRGSGFSGGGRSSGGFSGGSRGGGGGRSGGGGAGRR